MMIFMGSPLGYRSACVRKLPAFSPVFQELEPLRRPDESNHRAGISQAASV
jgi:hypothetical protein